MVLYCLLFNRDYSIDLRFSPFAMHNRIRQVAERDSPHIYGPGTTFSNILQHSSIHLTVLQRQAAIITSGLIRVKFHVVIKLF